MEDRVDDAVALVEPTLEAGRRAGAPDAMLCDLILRGSLAERTGRGLDEVERDVRQFIADAPYFAQGWRAELLLGEVDAAVGIYRSLAPQLDHLPGQVHEWLGAGLPVGIGDSRWGPAGCREAARCA